MLYGNDGEADEGGEGILIVTAGANGMVIDEDETETGEEGFGDDSEMLG